MMISFYMLPKELQELYQNDTTVRAYINYAIRDNTEYGDMLEKLVVQLAAEKKSAIEHAITISQTTISPRLFKHSQEGKS